MYLKCPYKGIVFPDECVWKTGQHLLLLLKVGHPKSSLCEDVNCWHPLAKHIWHLLLQIFWLLRTWPLLQQWTVSRILGYVDSCVSAALAALLQPDTELGPGLSHQLVLSYTWLSSGRFTLSLTNRNGDARQKWYQLSFPIAVAMETKTKWFWIVEKHLIIITLFFFPASFSIRDKIVNANLEVSICTPCLKFLA